MVVKDGEAGSANDARGHVLLFVLTLSVSGRKERYDFDFAAKGDDALKDFDSILTHLFMLININF